MCFANWLPEVSVIFIPTPLTFLIKDTKIMILDMDDLREGARALVTNSILTQRSFVAATSAQRPKEIVHFSHRISRMVCDNFESFNAG
jgi:hypothetical protein